MTTERPSQGQPSPKNTPSPQERGSRGSLVLSRKVVEKIAAQAAFEVSTAGGRSGGFFGIGAEADLRTRPKVQVDLTGQTASLVVDVAVAYPNPIADSAQQVRDQMMARVAELAGVEVSRVDVNITALTRRDVSKEVLR